MMSLIFSIHNTVEILYFILPFHFKFYNILAFKFSKYKVKIFFLRSGMNTVATKVIDINEMATN